jgi:hypothetical protein
VTVGMAALVNESWAIAYYLTSQIMKIMSVKIAQKI